MISGYTASSPELAADLLHAQTYSYITVNAAGRLDYVVRK